MRLLMTTVMILALIHVAAAPPPPIDMTPEDQSIWDEMMRPGGHKWGTWDEPTPRVLVMSDVTGEPLVCVLTWGEFGRRLTSELENCMAHTEALFRWIMKLRDDTVDRTDDALQRAARSLGVATEFLRRVITVSSLPHVEC